MESARDISLEMQARGEGRILDQFANPDNPLGCRGLGLDRQ
jgi:cysteine synthase B